MILSALVDTLLHLECGSMQLRKLILITMLSLTVLPVFANGARKKQIDPGLVKLVEEIDKKGSEVQSMRARFVQRKEISLLTEPVEMSGVFYMRKPDGIKFDFDPEDDLVLILSKEEMVTMSPEAKKASRIKLKKRKTELTRGLLSEKLSTLLGYFSMTRASSDSGARLILEPSRRKLRKKFKNVELWVNNEHLIHRVKITLKDGDIYELALTEIEENVEIKPNLFDTTIPDGYEMGERMESILGVDIEL